MDEAEARSLLVSTVSSGDPIRGPFGIARNAACSCARADDLRCTSGDRGAFFFEFNRSRRRCGAHRRCVGHSLPDGRRIQRRRYCCRGGFLVDRLSQARHRAAIVTVAGVNRRDPVPTDSESGHSTPRRARAHDLRSTTSDRYSSLPKFNSPRCRLGIEHSRVDHRFTNRRRIQRRRQRHRSSLLIDRLSQNSRPRDSIVTVAGINRRDPVPTSGKISHGTRRGTRTHRPHSTTGNRCTSFVERHRSRRSRGAHRRRVGHSLPDGRRIQRRQYCCRGDFLIDRLSKARRRRTAITAVPGINCRNPMFTGCKIGHSTRRDTRAYSLGGTTRDRRPSLLEFNRPSRRRRADPGRIGHHCTNCRRIQRRRHRRRSGFLHYRLSQRG